ncbi:MAG: hypothetical protein IJY65_03300 [Clostridia bacterium]|nr:hypothetical protein [Clostridia bacterium]
MKILFIGNSYTFFNDMPTLFERIAKASERDVSVTSVTRGGRKLCEHAESGDDCTKRLDELVAGTERFDAVVLQEQSLLPVIDYDKFLYGARKLKEKLAGIAESFVLYATWGRKAGSPDLPAHSLTHESMTAALADAYKRVGEDIGAKVACVGLNFHEVYTSHEEIELYNEDKSHPSSKGSALAALTIYHTLFGELPKSTDCLELSNSEKQIFSEVVSEGLKP